MTVLAGTAAAADAAATLIANAVNAEDRAIERRPARSLDPDSDLGDRPVTVAVGTLDAATVTDALDTGAAAAQAAEQAGHITAAVLVLQRHYRAVGAVPAGLVAAHAA